MEPWKIVLDEDAFHFFAASRASERRRLLVTFEELRNNPYRKSDYTSKDITGRDLTAWPKMPFLVTYWLDAFVSEVRIVNIQKIRF